MENYKIDFTRNVITISKEFEKKLNDIGSDEYALIQKLNKDFPQIRVTRRTVRTTRKNDDRGLSYAFMERYISYHDNCGELFKIYLDIKTIYNSYFHVKAWFVEQFPNYKETPTFINGKLHVNIINLEKYIDKPEDEDIKKTS